MSENEGESLQGRLDGVRDAVDAALGPMKRLAAVTAQIALSAIPADFACCCLCSIYEPHVCEGWRADGVVRQAPAAKVFGFQPPPVDVPVCHGCADVTVRKG